MSESLESLGRNQVILREVNERIESMAGENGAIEFVCECSDGECFSTLVVSIEKLIGTEFAQELDPPLLAKGS